MTAFSKLPVRLSCILFLLGGLLLHPATAKPLKVYILAGQSNMQGHAKVSTFEHIGMDPATAPLLETMQDADGNPRECEQVWISYLSKDLEKTGKLSAGYGASEDKIGPEFTFGITMQKHLDEPILLIKTAWGGKSLHTDFRPPGSGPYVFTQQQLDTFAKRGKNVEAEKAAKVEATGHYYRLMVDHVKKTLAAVDSVVPEYDSKEGYELAGFVWFQGWNDMVDSGVYPDRNSPGGYDNYSKLMAQFIRDIRAEFSAPAMPFVIGVMGVGGPTKSYGPDRQRYVITHQNFRDAMAAPASLPEFKNNVTAVFTETCWDLELQALSLRDEKVKQAAKKLQKEKQLKGPEAQALLEELRNQEFTESERTILEKGISNAAYHYLGSGKIMAQIGKSFAEALLQKHSSVEASAPGKTENNDFESIVFQPIPEGIPDFTKGASIPSNSPHDWNLGPTGARGWIYSNQLETSEARQILITEVEAGSPAEGKLKQGDVLLGIEQLPFQYDPRTELGKAITRAEASDGALRLIRWRNGTLASTTIRLPLLGHYSATAPFHCPKSKSILQRGCQTLASRMQENPRKGNPIARCYNALALLASGETRYWPIVREQVESFRNYTDPDRRDYHSWYYGPILILTAEYTLATGDREFLPDLERLALETARGQSAVGSWGHRFVQENGILSGYGMMNAPGLPLVIGLTLAREAGVKNSEVDQAIAKTTLLTEFYTNKGSIPYGDHRPWTQTHDDNGKNGAAAILFNLLGKRESTEFFSRMAIASHGAEREMGHTGNFFNLLWAMPSVALSGPEATGAWLGEYGWYYDLARRWDGAFRHQGPPQQKNDSYHNWDSTGAYLLAYAQPLRKTHLTGKRQGIVSPIDTKTASSLIEDGKGWSPRFKNEPYRDRDEEFLFANLRSWSPIVRERAARALANRQDIAIPKLVSLLNDEDLHAKTGACQALAMQKSRAAPAVSALRKLIRHEDLWLRIEAAEALAAIGSDAMPAVPDLLQLLANHDIAKDPRGMQNRYLCFALFDRRDGLLRNSLEGVDHKELFAAVRIGLANEDGRARGTLGSVFKNLSYEEIQPLLPSIIEAVATPAPSGIMFADGIRISGLEILAKNKHEEGLDHFLAVLGPDRWGQGNRIPKCLKVLQEYGGAAKQLVPELRKLESTLLAKNKPPQDQLALLRETIAKIEDDNNPPRLRNVKTL